MTMKACSTRVPRVVSGVAPETACQPRSTIPAPRLHAPTAVWPTCRSAGTLGTTRSKFVRSGQTGAPNTSSARPLLAGAFRPSICHSSFVIFLRPGSNPVAPEFASWFPGFLINLRLWCHPPMVHQCPKHAPPAFFPPSINPSKSTHAQSRPVKASQGKIFQLAVQATVIQEVTTRFKKRNVPPKHPPPTGQSQERSCDRNHHGRDAPPPAHLGTVLGRPNAPCGNGCETKIFKMMNSGIFSCHSIYIYRYCVHE